MKELIDALGNCGKGESGYENFCTSLNLLGVTRGVLFVGRGETKLSQGRYSRRDTAFLEQLERLRSKVDECEGLKPNAQGLKNTLNCVEQE